MNELKPLVNHLEKAIDSICESYDDTKFIDNLESAALPNKRAVIFAFEKIAPIIYLGFYSTRPLSRHNLRYAISENVYPAFETLTEQIHRAVTYEAARGRMPNPKPHFAEEASLKLFQCLPELREMLNEDALAAYQHDPAARSVEEVVFSYPSLVAITAHRVAHLLHRQGVPLIPRIISEYAHSRTGIDMNPGAKIGRRIFIDHGTGIVIGETAELGDDIKIYQGVTLGALSGKRAPNAPRNHGKRHPTIGDRVTIYSGATILGGDTVIGSDSIIGGNVWLVRSVAPDSKIFGRPRPEIPASEVVARADIKDLENL